MVIVGSLEQIPPGEEGLRAKIERIRWLVADAVRDVDFRQMAVEQLRGVRARDWDGEIRAVRKFVMRMRFTRDPYAPGGLEVFTHPKTMLLQILGGTGYGDCDDHVLLATAMLEVIGHQTRYRVGGTRRGSYQHIWIEVLHPTRGWVPLELIKPVSVGWDPGPLFAHTETHASQMNGLGGAITVTIDPQTGGGPSRQTVRSKGFGSPLPSDVFRAIKQGERRAGITAQEMTGRDGIGWIAAAIQAATAAGGAYYSHEQQRKERRRARRRRTELQASGMPEFQAREYAPDPRRIDYTPFIQQIGASGAALYNEFSYQNPYTDSYFQQRQREASGAFIGPPTPRPPGSMELEARARAFYDAGQRFQPPDWDAQFQRQMAAARGAGAPGRDYYQAAQGFVAKARGAYSGVTGAAGSFGRGDYQEAKQMYRGVSFSQLLESGKDLTGQEREALLSYLQTSGNNLQGLGEDPTDPGPYVPTTKALAMPPGWSEAVQLAPSAAAWDWEPALHQALALVAADQVAPNYLGVPMNAVFDVNTAPEISGASGGRVGWDKHWGGGAQAILNAPVVHMWLFFFALTHHPRLLAGASGNWLGYLKWVLAAIDKPAKAAWMSDETARREAWQTRKDLWKEFSRQSRAAEAAKQQAEDAKRRADEAAARARKRTGDLNAQRRADEAARNAIVKAREAEEQRLRAEAAAQARFVGPRPLPGVDYTARGLAQRAKPKMGTGMMIGLAAGAFFLFGKKR